jgi:hypothetical protein
MTDPHDPSGHLGLHPSRHRALIKRVLDSQDPDDLRAMAAAVWASVARHPAGASCECPIIDALVVLADRKEGT